MLPKSDLEFRILLTISFIIGWYIRFKMEKQTQKAVNIKSVESKRETLTAKMGNIAFGLPIIYILTTFFDFAHIDLPSIIRWVGLIILFSGNAVFYAAHTTLGKNWSATLDIKENHALVTNGIYNYVRHPMYLGFFLLAFGIFLSSANWLLGIVAVGFSLFLYNRRIEDEEKMMIDTFGNQYKEYMQRTGRLLPKLF